MGAARRGVGARKREKRAARPGTPAGRRGGGGERAAGRGRGRKTTDPIAPRRRGRNGVVSPGVSTAAAKGGARPRKISPEGSIL